MKRHGLWICELPGVILGAFSSDWIFEERWHSCDDICERRKSTLTRMKPSVSKTLLYISIRLCFGGLIKVVHVNRTWRHLYWISTRPNKMASYNQRSLFCLIPCQSNFTAFCLWCCLNLNVQVWLYYGLKLSFLILIFLPFWPVLCCHFWELCPEFCPFWDILMLLYCLKIICFTSCSFRLPKGNRYRNGKLLVRFALKTWIMLCYTGL